MSPLIHTSRLTLRPFVDSDLDDLYAFHSHPEVARFLYWNPRDRDQTKRALDSKKAAVALETEGSSLVLAVELNGRVIGEVSLVWRSREHQQGEIGFVFHPEFQGQGYATEAARAILELAFSEAGLHRVYGRCDARNAASYRLMERLGMRREAHFLQNEK